jgi:hypothetical protein
VTKQPVLTNFPSTIIATAKRRLQASIRKFRASVIRDSLSGYSVLFADVLPRSFFTAIDPTRRQRSFGHVPVFWAWMAQILEGNASCQRGLSLLQAWYQACKLPVPQSGTSGYCQGRLRLTTDFLAAIHERILEVLMRRRRNSDLWHGLQLKAIDGSSLQLSDTPANQEAYRQPSRQKTGCGFPVMGISGILNLSHGGWEAIECSDYREHDARVAQRMTAHIGEGDLLLADRAYCSYQLIATLQQHGAHALMRLHQARHRALDWRQGRRLSRIARLVTWQKPPKRPKGSELNQQEWDALPEEMEVRMIKMGFEDRSGRRREMIVVTTLLDNDQYDDNELSELYARRWDIELKLRDLKTTLGLEMLAVRTPEMARKTVLMMMIANNLIRTVMQQAAIEAGQPVWQMSFKGTIDLTLASHQSFRPLAQSPGLARERRRQFIEICATKMLNIRPYRLEPRAVKRRPKSHSYLTKPRAIFREIPHREHHRKPR